MIAAAPIAIHLNLNGPLSPAVEAALHALIQASTAHLMAMGGEAEEVEALSAPAPASPRALAPLLQEPRPVLAAPIAEPEPQGQPQVAEEKAPSSAVVEDAKQLPRTRRPWSEEELNDLIAMLHQGKTDREISHALDRPEGSISTKMAQLRFKGVKLPSRTPLAAPVVDREPPSKAFVVPIASILEAPDEDKPVVRATPQKPRVVAPPPPPRPPVTSAQAEAAGIAAGQTHTVAVEVDTAPRKRAT